METPRRTSRRTWLCAPCPVLAALLAALLLALCLASHPLLAQGMSGIAGGSSSFGPDGMASLPDADPPTTTDRLTGIVVSSADSKPVARVLVTSGNNSFAALTDDEGRFFFDLRRPLPQSGDADAASANPILGLSRQNTMPVQFRLRKPGYINSNATVNFSMARPDTPQPPIQLTIQPAAIITGRVDAESGDLPANLFVGLYRKNVQIGRASWNLMNVARLDPDGRFRAADLSPGDFKLGAYAVVPLNGRQDAASVPGLLPAYDNGATSLDTATPIHIAAGESATADFTLRRATFYRVTIPLAGDGAQQGVRVVLAPQIPNLTLSYNTRDRALEGYLPPGEYDAHLISQTSNQNRNPDSSCGTVHLSVADAPVQTKPVTMLPAPPIPIEITRDYSYDPSNLNRGGFIFGLQPVDPGAGSAYGVNNGNNHESEVVAHACAGSYNLVFNGSESYPSSITSGGTDLLNQPLLIDDGVAPQPILVTLRDDYASLNVRLAPSAVTSAQTSANGMVYAIAIPLDRVESQPVGPGGISIGVNPRISTQNATFSRLPPGHYLVLAAADLQFLLTLEYRNPDVLHDLTAQGATVEVSPGDKADIEIPLLHPNSAGAPPYSSQTQIIYAGAQ